MLLNRLVGFRKLNMFFLIIISFIGAVYSLYLYSFRQHGMIRAGVYSFFPCSLREYLLLLMH